MLFNELVEKIQPFLNENNIDRKKAVEEIRAMYAKEVQDALKRDENRAKERAELEQARSEMKQFYADREQARKQRKQVQPAQKKQRLEIKVDKKINQPKKPKMLNKDELAKRQAEAAKRRDEIMARIMDEIRGNRVNE